MDYLIAPERFETSEFVLRSYRPGDGALVADAQNTSLDHLRPWMPWAQESTTAAGAEVNVRRFRAKYLLAEDFVIGIFNPAETELLGGTGFHLREGPLSTQSAEIGMFIRASAAGQGLGSRILRSMLKWGFSDWPWERLSWRCDSRNKASIRAAEKAGMDREGLLRSQPREVGSGRRDTVLFAALRNEWLQTSHHPPDKKEQNVG